MQVIRRAVKKFPEFLWFEKERQQIRYDRRITIVELEQDAGISHGSIHAVLPNDLKMRLVSAKFVPCGFCITMTHRATHLLLCSNSSPRKAFLSLPNHRTLWISLRVTFGCSLLLKYSSRRRVSHHGGHRIECDGWTPEDSKRSLPPVHPTTAGSMEQVCVCARVWLWRLLGKRCHMFYHYSAVPQFRELCDCPSYKRCLAGTVGSTKVPPCAVSIPLLWIVGCCLEDVQVIPQTFGPACLLKWLATPSAHEVDVVL